MAHFGDLVNEIYLGGLTGQRPQLPMTADGLEVPEEEEAAESDATPE